MRIARFRVLFFSSKYFCSLPRETNIRGLAYLRVVSDWGAKFRGFFAREFRKYVRKGRQRKRARGRRIRRDTGSAKVSLDNPITFLGTAEGRGWFTACGIANPLAFLHLPPHRVLSPFSTNRRVPLSSSFLGSYASVAPCSSLRPSDRG